MEDRKPCVQEFAASREDTGPAYLPSPSPSPARAAKRKTVASSNAAERKKGAASVKVEGGHGGAGGPKRGSWTKKEVRQLWDALGLVPGINWSDVADKVDGRDKLNKWRYDLLPKVQAFIDSLGE